MPADTVECISSDGRSELTCTFSHSIEEEAIKALSYLVMVALATVASACSPEESAAPEESVGEAAAAVTTNTLNGGDSLGAGSGLTSTNGVYTVTVKSNGTWKLAGNGLTKVFPTTPPSSPGTGINLYLALSNDLLALRNDKTPIADVFWTSDRTSTNPAGFAKITNAGKFFVQDSTGIEIWSVSLP